MANKDALLTLEDLDLYLLAHRAIRQDLARFSARVPTLRHAAGGTTRAIGMGEWFERLRALLEQHHQGEDSWLFPLLVERDPAWASHEAELAADHHKLDPLLASAGDRFRALARAAGPEFDARRDELASDLLELETLMSGHLEREEAATIPAMTATVTYREFMKLERASAKGVPMSTMMLILPWVMDVADEGQQAKIAGVIPWPVRMLYRFSWKKKYDRLTSSLAASDLAATG